MRIIHLNYSDAIGGASRAAYRIHRALIEAGVESRMWVNQDILGDQTVESFAITKKQKIDLLLRNQIGRLLNLLLKTKNLNTHSAQFINSNWVERINSSDADIVNLHWVQEEMLSVEDIGRIKKPVVWTLHDMWAFSGAEHYSEDYRWRDGYHRGNRPTHESGFDLNRWTWRRKKKAWRTPMQIVVPSSWLGKCVQASSLMCGWPIAVIPNCIDTKSWRPISKIAARELLGLPTEVPLVLFGAIGGGKDSRKGFDLLTEALQYHKSTKETNIELVVFGQLAPKKPLNIGYPVHYVGHKSDDISLQLLYSAVDALVIPSRQDNLPNTGVEALACGTPVVAFNTCGLSDIVIHLKTGYLAKSFDPKDLARGISWVVGHFELHNLSKLTRLKAIEKFDNRTIATQYYEIYKKMLNK
jgi:glycosyltransferase involved in cell wall biosynthesis